MKKIYIAISIGAIICLLTTILLYRQKTNEARQDISSDELYDLINMYRKENGREILKVNPELEQSATAKVDDMIKKNYWSHNESTDNTVWKFIKDTGFDFSYAGENLAKDMTTDKDIIEAWKLSEKHNKNLLDNNFTDMGLAYQCNIQFQGKKDTCLVVLHLGKKKL
jgi:uncharacterized protein YkwD